MNNKLSLEEFSAKAEKILREKLFHEEQARHKKNEFEQLVLQNLGFSEGASLVEMDGVAKEVLRKLPKKKSKQTRLKKRTKEQVRAQLVEELRKGAAFPTQLAAAIHIKNNVIQPLLKELQSAGLASYSASSKGRGRGKIWRLVKIGKVTGHRGPKQADDTELRDRALELLKKGSLTATDLATVFNSTVPRLQRVLKYLQGEAKVIQVKEMTIARDGREMPSARWKLAT